MAKDVATLTRLITDFRQINSKDSISPESLGFLLQSILDTLDEIAFRHVDSAEASIKELSQQFGLLSQRLETLIGENASDAIDNFNEVLAFLGGLRDNERLASTLNYLHSRIAQNTSGVDEINKSRESEHATMSAVTALSSLSFSASEDGVAVDGGLVNPFGGASEMSPVEFPVAEAPFAGDGMARPRPGRAGVVSGADFGRFDSAATFAEDLAGETAIRDIGFSASADKVSFTRTKYRLDGGNPWVDADGSPVAVPIDGLWPFPMASETGAGAVTAAQARAIANAPELAFRELWKSAGCPVKEDADPSEMYVCNGLGMSYAEARAVYAAGVMTNIDIDARYAGMSIRTHLPSQIRWGASAPAPTTFRGSSVEVVAAPLLTPGTGCFRDCTKLRKASVYSPRGTGAGSDAWAGCKALETLTVAVMLPGSFSLADSPLISLASLQGIIAKTQAGMAAFTITLHPDTYAKMTDTERETEWTRLPELAAAKNITFTTTT